MYNKQKHIKCSFLEWLLLGWIFLSIVNVYICTKREELVLLFLLRILGGLNHPNRIWRVKTLLVSQEETEFGFCRVLLPLLRILGGLAYQHRIRRVGTLLGSQKEVDFEFYRVVSKPSILCCWTTISEIRLFVNMVTKRAPKSQKMKSTNQHNKGVCKISLGKRVF